MKKDIEWLKKEVWKQDIVMDKGYIYTDDLMSIINEVDEPEVLSQELPVIPKYVADWITRYREKYDLYTALRWLENNTFVWGEIYEWYRMNTRKFVNAYFTGEYEVEEEQLYHALIKGHELVNNSAKYWIYDKESPENVFVGHRIQKYARFKEYLSKSEWNKLGVNDSNAEFVKVNKRN